MINPLIEKLYKDTHEDLVTFELTKHERQMILVGLKLYDAYEEVLNNALKEKYEGVWK